jgi:hypothetical protein
MPLFGRSDGVQCKNEPLVRQIMPFMMKGRNESIVLHESRLDLTRTRSWLDAFNEKRELKATLFHLCLWAFARALHARPGLNRFISGGRIYERKGVFLSFAAKKAFKDDAPIVTIKLEFPKDEPFGACVDRIYDSVGGARSGKKTSVDTELKLALMLPGFLVSFVMWFLRKLDYWNLMPGGMIKGDPMFASAFLANLGSIGIDHTFHHLYEYGNISLFGAIGRAGKTLFIDEDGKPVVKDGLEIRWSFDERINDGFYCVSSLKIAQHIIEDPAKSSG